jgi:hypothetical protein
MADKKEMYDRLKNNPKNIRFSELCKAAEMFGFRFRGGKEESRSLCKRRSRGNSELSECWGQGKTGVNQLLKVIEKYNLLEED